MMAMANLDRLTTLAATFAAIHPPPLAPADAETIIAISQLVVDIDGREGAEEIHLFFAIGKLLHQLAGTPDADIPTFASDEDDESRMFELATLLKAAPARELAYAIARLLAAVDLEVAPVEDEFLDRLRGILAIDKTRAASLTVMMRDVRG
ncbi:MAG: hypothetical protein NT062_00705 [Proteobacteria bacterium]|nr:hypothetical protein [Pseudomonadota bacterium]